MKILHYISSNLPFPLFISCINEVVLSNFARRRLRNPITKEVKVFDHNTLDHLWIGNEEHRAIASEDAKKLAIFLDIFTVQLRNGLFKAEKVANKGIRFRTVNASLNPVVEVAC